LKIKTIGSRGVLFTYEADECALGGNYSVYLINGEKNVYICDTHLGPESMKPIKDYLRSNGLDKKQLVVFLSHSDWDHIWGVCAFPKAIVVAHEKCSQRMFDRGLLELKRYHEYQNGDIKLVYPNLTFDSRLTFREDGVEFIYAPGHTIDSAICYDRKDSVLFLGDLVERPEPVISHHDLETYIDTLEILKGFQTEAVVSSHSGLVDERDMEDNIQFIRNFQERAMVETGDHGNSMAIKLYTMLMYEDAIQQTAGDSFDYPDFQREFWGSLGMDYLNSESALLQNIEYEELRLALESYMIEL